MSKLRSHHFYFFMLIFLSAIAFLVILPNFIFIENENYRFISTRGLSRFQKPAYVDKLKKILNCVDSRLKFEKIQYGSYWLIRNLIRGTVSDSVGCTETITYTTNGDFTFLETLPAVLKRWHAPISFALFAPGTDLWDTMASIQYVRNCLPESNLIRQYVSFHLFFPMAHMPFSIPLTEEDALTWDYSCDMKAPYLKISRETMYKSLANLTYPINVGRNIARKSVNTHFIFACDIELIPTRGIPHKFLQMMADNTSLLPTEATPRVFVLPVFELRSNVTHLPETKTELNKMMKIRDAIPFHYYVCSNCHLVPGQKYWLKENDTETFSITAVGKRQDKFKYWEPFYISDNSEPIFDERVTWEGQSNKRIQNYAMCLMDYDYHVLHPPFLVHTPGIKKYNKHTPRIKYVAIMNGIIHKIIEPEYRILYGTNSKCRT